MFFHKTKTIIIAGASRFGAGLQVNFQGVIQELWLLI